MYTDIEKYIKKEDDLALNKYEIDDEIKVILVPYKEISYKYDSGYGAYCCELVENNDEMPDTFKISGNFNNQLNIGQTYEAFGKVQVYNRKKQLKIEKIKKVEPKTSRTIKQFLKSLNGMGPFYDIIYDEYGEDSLNIIRKEPLELKKLSPGLYDNLVLDWQKQLLELKDSEEYLTKLINIGLKPIQAKHFYDLYQELCIEKLKENPYRLINEISGFGFLKSDTIAKNIGFPPDNEIRISEAIIFILNSTKYDGNTYMKKIELLNKVSDLLAIKLPINETKKLYKENCNKEKTLYSIGNLTFNIDIKDIKKSLDNYNRASLSKSKKGKNDAKLIIFHIEIEKILQQINFLKISGDIILKGNLENDDCKIYDKQLFLAEEYIAQKLYKIESNSEVCDINIEPLLKNYLEKNKIELETEQYNAVLNSAGNIGGFSVINGSAGCVDCDTEFFNGYEWKKISKYNIKDKVLQYNKDGTTELVTPSRYIKQEKDYLWQFHSKYGIDQCLSENHNCIIFDEEQKLKEIRFKNLKETYLRENNKEKFETAFSYSGTGMDINDDLIKIFIALHLNNCHLIEDNKVNISLKNNFKKIKLLKLLLSNKVNFYYQDEDIDFYYENENFYNKKNRSLDKRLIFNFMQNLMKTDIEDFISDFQIVFSFNINKFSKEWYNCNKNQLKLISEEIIYWNLEDNNKIDLKLKNIYNSKIKENADFIQFIFSSLNKRAIICSEKDVKEYNVLLSDEHFVSFCNKENNEEIKKYKTKDGFEYCFTVPSHMLVLRRNNKIFITGNCGKTFTLNIALKLIEYVYVKKFGYFEPIVLAPTGRAAKVAALATKRESSTIHKALKPMIEGGFYYNAQNNLPYNCIICDETSMLDVEIAKSLLESISNRTKVIFIGDTKQLASVGPGNVLKDIIDSKKFKITTLTVAKRQALNSGIYKNALRIINSEMITTEKETGDAFVYKALENEIVLEKILKLYDNLYENLSIDKIQVLVPQKAGLIGTNYLNYILQEKYNKNTEKLRILNRQISITLTNGKSVKYDLFFQKNDKVIHTENDYKLPWYQRNGKNLILDERNICGVSNGETGRIVQITQIKDENRNVINQMIVKYEDKYIIYSNDFSKLDHAYAMTIHKSQGSEWDAIIMPITFSSYNMLERNLLYTGYTRSKKWISVIGDPDAIKYAIKTTKSSERQTGLKDRINEVYKKETT